MRAIDPAMGNVSDELLAVAKRVLAWFLRVLTFMNQGAQVGAVSCLLYQRILDWNAAIESRQPSIYFRRC